ncbi:hypothetical protein [Defluviicoccus vanus]|uniref:Uncharacterized protein n=1 Tax=Defluviicoccus vanus TaxID=111831 RepID=A0A7H1MZ56_9PROT|nr:hypothetical protein [Defluviicoccus vanus]QNT68742.1 hypothetical protein HQ394_04360 [Defluviicoccus vanus]
MKILPPISPTPSLPSSFAKGHYATRKTVRRIFRTLMQPPLSSMFMVCAVMRVFACGDGGNRMTTQDDK